MGTIQKVAPVILCLLLTGCDLFKTKEPAGEAELVIAIKHVKDEWTKDCDGVGALPENSVYYLLDDYNAVVALAATCRERHNSAMRYLRPIVEKYKAKAP